MPTGPSDRRQNRSHNIHDALSNQLAASAERAKFSAMVLADDLGLVVATAGNKGVCEQMAALSPLLAPGMKSWHGAVETNKGRVRLSVAPVRIDNTLLYLSASEGKQSQITRELFTSGKGISRILN